MENIIASVIVPTFNRKGHLFRLLGFLLNQTFSKDSYEIIIIDDGSSDGTSELMNKFASGSSPLVKYFYQERAGPASARNRGIKAALGEIIIFTDSDCMPDRYWVEELVKAYNNNIYGVGGVIKGASNNNIISKYCSYIRMNESPKTIDNDIVYLITGNASFKKIALLKISGFDERYNFPGGEDPDLCYRLKREGYSFGFNRKAVVFNSHKNTLFDLVKTYFNYGKGDAFLTLKMNCGWDLMKPYSPMSVVYFLKFTVRIMIKTLNFVVIFAINLMKIPFRCMKYYGEGLSIKLSLIYSVLNYAVIVSFVLGRFFGYILGKFKGFKKSEISFNQ